MQPRVAGLSLDAELCFAVPSVLASKSGCTGGFAGSLSLPPTNNISIPLFVPSYLAAVGELVVHDDYIVLF